MTQETALLVSMLIHVPTAVGWIAFAAIEAAAITLPGMANRQRGRLIRALGWPTVVLLLVILTTGIWQTMDNPFQPVSNWATLEKLRDTTVYGMSLFIKHIFVFITFALSLAIRFVLAPRLQPDSDRVGGLLTAAVWLNVAACVAALLATARMTIQLH